MAIMWSRIHAELGLSPTPLTHDMVVQAIAQRVRENEDLDWKKDLAWKRQDMPAKVKEEKKQEFAKDVAAMANTRGGLIVFGVREESEEAVELTGVPNDEHERQPLRALAWRHVRPLVAGLVIEPLNDAAGGQGLIVVSVPASPDAPHVVGEKNELGVPYRDGSDTRWMTEGQLERAYRDRFARRADDRTALSALTADLAPEIDLESGVWVAVAARPVAPMPPTLGRPQREQATATVREMLNVAEAIQPVGMTDRVPMLRDLLPPHALDNPRAGLRRWALRSNPHTQDPAERADWAYVELHHDGSMALAARLAGWEDYGIPNAYGVHFRTVDSLIVDAVALAAAHARSLGSTGTLLIRAAFELHPGATRPLVAVDNRRMGQVTTTFRVLEGTRAVRNPVAVEAEFAADDDVDALRRVARQLAEDLDHQFGMGASSIPE
jgi:hypothetical protein